MGAPRQPPDTTGPSRGNSGALAASATESRTVARQYGPMITEPIDLSGFTGWVPFAELPNTDVPTSPGVYVVVRPTDDPPMKNSRLTSVGPSTEQWWWSLNANVCARFQ